MRSKSYFSVKTQFENVGDALINRELIRLAADFSDVVVDISRCPDRFIKTLGIDRIAGVEVVRGTRALFRKALSNRRAGRHSYYFLSPGGYAGNSSGSMTRRWVNAWIVRALHSAGIRVCQLGVSYENLRPAYARLLTWRSKYLFRQLVRDPISAEYARTLGMRVDGLMPDLAYNLFDRDPASFAPFGARKRVALSFRVGQGPGQAIQVRSFVRFLSTLFPADVEFAFFAQVEMDEPFMAELHQEFSRENMRPTTYSASSCSIEGCLEFYERCDIVFANRLHALLMGASRIGRLIACVNEGTNLKIEGLMRMADFDENVISLDGPFDVALRARLDRRMPALFSGLTDRRKLGDAVGEVFGSATPPREWAPK